MKVLTDEVIASFKDAARMVTGAKPRAFEAQVTLDYLEGSVWKAERVFGWSHHTVALGLNELRTYLISAPLPFPPGNRRVAVEPAVQRRGGDGIN